MSSPLWGEIERGLMLTTTKGIVLRSIKYGETSLVSNIFTRTFGVQSYMVQGVRSSKAKNNKAALLQPATLLDLVVYQKPNVSLQRLRDFQHSYIYQNLQEEVVKNSIALFSSEVLLRLLPEHADQPDLFDFAEDYFIQLDKMSLVAVANFPVFFLIKSSDMLGYSVRGHFTEETPHLNLYEGAYTQNPPMIQPYVSEELATALDKLRSVNEIAGLEKVELNAAIRYELLEWYIMFLQQHTQHLGAIKSLAVLKTILH